MKTRNGRHEPLVIRDRVREVYDLVDGVDEYRVTIEFQRDGRSVYHLYVFEWYRPFWPLPRTLIMRDLTPSDPRHAPLQLWAMQRMAEIERDGVTVPYPEEVDILINALDVIACSTMGEPSVHGRAYEEQVIGFATAALARYRERRKARTTGA